MKRFLGITLVILLIFFMAGCGGSDEMKNTTIEESIEVDPVIEEPIVEITKIDEFIELYNQSAPVSITDAIEIDIRDKDGGHYRTEFRLTAFDDAIAKTGKLGDMIIDLVYCDWFDEFRIYVDGITPEQAAEIIKYAAPIMDPDVSSEELQDVLDYLTGTNDYHNGYFGNLCMTFSETYGELMLRTD